jgi:thymidine phosphorylase
MIDPAVGVEVFVHVGDKVEPDEMIARIHANDEAKLEEARSFIKKAIQYSDEKSERLPLFYGVIEGSPKVKADSNPATG